jgi:AraC-like DNA-binding protein
MDVVSDLLGAVRLQADVFGRFEVRTPWAVRVPAAAGELAFYLMAEGDARLEIEGEPGQPMTLSAGDIVLLPHGSGLVLRDTGRGERDVRILGPGDCPGPTSPTPFRFGGDGPLTIFVSGAFRFGTPTRNVLLDSLPAVLHVSAGDMAKNPQLAAAVQLVMAESAAPGPGSSILTSRLAEILLIHALRELVRTRDGSRSSIGLCALADPAVGSALKLIHARPAESWTVERLAREVAMSRSAFAARFTQLVGVPPLQYITQWRMTDAAQRLREGEDSVARIAQQVGYGNAAAFMKAFARTHGVGPGTYRRQARPGRTRSVSRPAARAESASVL